MSGQVKRVKAARVAARRLAVCETDLKNQALRRIIAGLQAASGEIAAANEADIKRAQEEGLNASLLKRLYFGNKKLEATIAAIEDLIHLEDPVGKVLNATRLDSGLDLYQVRCPLGVIAVVFESRPDALVQIATLALKSGNAVILKGGREARETNYILFKTIAESSANLIGDAWITLLEDRSEVNELLGMDEDIDLMIPRGSNEFVRYIMDHTRIPVLGHADGICHTYVASSSDYDRTMEIVIDAKTEYPAVCNATETLLIDRGWPSKYRSALINKIQASGVTLYADEELAALYGLQLVSDWRTEYLDLAMSVKFVTNTDEAIAHINRYGSGHTDAICTRVREQAEQFMAEVDSANVFWNCSTRFADGFRYGFGAEVGVSTSKIHARGPVGLDGLMTYKYKLYGSGQIVKPYNNGELKFIHDKIDVESI